MADYCRQALIHRGIAPPYNLLAMSLGAMVAVAFARSVVGCTRMCRGWAMTVAQLSH